MAKKKASAKTKRGLLQHYADEGFVPPDNWNADELVRVEVRRLMLNSFMGCIAAETPRRLGGGVDSNSLAGDKFLSKGIANTYWVCWRRLTSAKHAPLPIEDIGEDESFLIPPETWLLLHAKAMTFENAKERGRTVIWLHWWEELRPRLLARRRAIATWSMINDKYDWGYRVVTGIGSEIEWVDGKFDDWAFRYDREQVVD